MRASTISDLRTQVEQVGLPVWLHAEPDGSAHWERYRVDDLERDFPAQATSALEAAVRRASGGVRVVPVVVAAGEMSN